ncbi:MAG: AzlC family ABC transporter permease [Aestuariivirga sp.]
MNSFKSEFRTGFADMLPMLVAYVPIAMLWGTLAAAKGFSPLEALAMSAMVYAGASQFVAIEMWRDPLPILLMVVTIFVVNLRHVLYSASIARHMDKIPSRLQPILIYVLTDEAWALLERRALAKPLTLGYFIGVAVPLWPTWFLSSTLGAFLGKALGDPAVIGLDFAFAAMFISILVGFWKGPRTGAVIAASAVAAILGKLFVPGAWFIMLGGITGVIAAVLLHVESET